MAPKASHDPRVKDIYAKFIDALGDVRPSEELRKTVQRVLLKVCPMDEVHRLFVEFEKLDSQVGQDFELHTFLDWLFDSNPHIFGGVGEQQATNAANTSNPGGSQQSAAKASQLAQFMNATIASSGQKPMARRSDPCVPVVQSNASAVAQQSPASQLARLPALSEQLASLDLASIGGSGGGGGGGGPARLAAPGSIRPLTPPTAQGFQSKAASTTSSAFEWTLAKWIGSLRKLSGTKSEKDEADSASESHSMQGIIARRLLEAIEQQQKQDQTQKPSELQSVHKLANLSPDDRKTVIRDCLQKATADMEELLEVGLRSLEAADIQTSRDVNRKYSADIAGTFDLSYSSLDIFLGGLESMVGRPDAPIVLTMWHEHCRAGPNSESDLYFKSENYGIFSNSRTEFTFALFGEEGIGQPMQEQDISRCVDELENFDLQEEVATVMKDAPQLETAWENLQAKLNELEGLSDTIWKAKQRVPAAFQALQAFSAMRDLHTRKELKRQNKKCSAPAEDPEMLKDPDQARCSLPLKYFRLEFFVMNKLLKSIGEIPLQPAELIGVRLYTGPLHQKYNAVLCMFSGVNSMIDRWREQCIDNMYTATAHVINSACYKISKVQEAVTVYRGIKHGSLPQPFVEPDSFGLQGGIEFGFMSTTTDREVAMGSGSRKTSGTIFEIQQGMMDRGASLEWVSQYPHEKEVCFGPLSAMQVIGFRVEDALRIVEVRMRSAMRSLTIEEVIAKRRSIIEDMCKSLNQEAKLTLLALQDASTELKDFIESLSRKVQESFLCLHSEEGEWYNHNAQFKACTVSAIDLREAVVGLGHALMKKGNLFERAQAYRKLRALNMLSNGKLSDIIDSNGQVNLGTDLQLDRLELSPSIRGIFEDLGKDNKAATRLDNMINSLRPFKETLEKNSSTTRDAEGACGSMASIAKESYLLEYEPDWRDALAPCLEQLLRQLVGYLWDEERSGPSAQQMGLRLAAVKAVRLLLEVDDEVCNDDLVTNLVAWCIPSKDSRNAVVDPNVRSAAIGCLEYCRPFVSKMVSYKVLKPGALEPVLVETTASKELCKLLAEQNESKQVVESAESVLKQLGSEVIIDATTKAGEELNPQVRMSALKLVLSCEEVGKKKDDQDAKQGDQDAQATPDQDQKQGDQELKKNDQEAVRSQLPQYLCGIAAKDPIASLRRRAMDALGNLGLQAIGSIGVDVVFEGAEDIDVKVRESALKTLLAWIGSSGRQKNKVLQNRISESVCKMAQTDADVQIRRRALEALLDAWNGDESGGNRPQGSEATTLNIMDLMCSVAEKESTSTLRARAIEVLRTWITRTGYDLESQERKAKKKAVALRLFKISEEDQEWKIRQRAVTTLADCEAKVIDAVDGLNFWLRRLTQESDADVKVAILGALAKYKVVDVRGVNLVAHCAAMDSEQQVRAAAYLALGDFGAEALLKSNKTDVLFAHLAEDSDSLVRAANVRALGKLGLEALGSSGLALLLERATEDDSGDVRAAVLRAFPQLGLEVKDTGSLVNLLTMSAKEDPEWFVRQQAIETLSCFGPEVIGLDAVRVVVDIAREDADEDVRTSALRAVESFGAEVLTPTDLETLGKVASGDKSPEVCPVAQRTHNHIKAQVVFKENGVEGLINMLKPESKDASLHLAAARLLGEADPKALGESGIAALNTLVDKQANDREHIAAHAALCRLQVEVKNHLEPLINYLRSDNSTWDLKRAAAEGLGRLPPEALVGCECEDGGVENITLACEVVASSNSAMSRCALEGEKGDFWYCDALPSSHWLRLTLPEGMKLQHLVASVNDFGTLSPTRMRVLVGNRPHPASMTKLAEVALDERKYTVSLLSEADLKKYYSACQVNPGDTSLPLRCVHIEIDVGVFGSSCKVGGLQVFAAWGSAKLAKTAAAPSPPPDQNIKN